MNVLCESADIFLWTGPKSAEVIILDVRTAPPTCRVYRCQMFLIEG